MIPIYVQTDWKGIMAEIAKGSGVRYSRKVVKQANVEIGEYWHKTFLKRHFQPGARARYGYTPRTEGYRRQKARLQRQGKIEGGPNLDLVKTGITKRSTRTATIKGYPTRVTITFPTPRYIGIRPRSGRTPLSRELLKVTAEEIKKLQEIGAKSVRRQLKKAPGRLRKRTK